MIRKREREREGGEREREREKLTHVLITPEGLNQNRYSVSRTCQGFGQNKNRKFDGDTFANLRFERSSC